MKKILLTRQDIIKLKKQNEEHFKSNLKKLFNMIPKAGKKGGEEKW